MAHVKVLTCTSAGEITLVAVGCIFESDHAYTWIVDSLVDWKTRAVYFG